MAIKYKASIIIPCYFKNQELVDMTRRCLESITGTKDIIVVNDGSPIATDMDKIYYPDNQGYAHAVNEGLKKAKGEYLIICNNDIIFIQPDWMEHLLRPFKQSWGAGISLIRTTEPDGWQVENRYEENAKFGSLWAMTRQTYETLGPLDERFGKGYGEDLDYWHRARNAGIKIIKNHNGLAEHLGKATFKVVDPQDKAFNRFVFEYKKKWGDESHIFLLDEHTIISFNDWELKGMSDGDKKTYTQREISLEELERRDGMR